MQFDQMEERRDGLEGKVVDSCLDMSGLMRPSDIARKYQGNDGIY